MDVVIDRCDNGFVITFNTADRARRVYYPNLESVLCAVHDAFDPPGPVHYNSARDLHETARGEPLRHRPIGEAA